MANAGIELRDVDFRIGALDQRVDFIDTQLAQMDPHGQAVSTGGERLMGPADRLRALRIELSTLLSTYTDQHPRVIGLKQEIAELERIVAEESASRSATPDNPAYIQLTAQRREAASERDALRARRGELQASIARYQRAQAEMPAVEAEYGAISRSSSGPSPSTPRPGRRGPRSRGPGSRPGASRPGSRPRSAPRGSCPGTPPAP